MHIGIISLEQNGQLTTISGALSRKGFIRDKVDIARDASALEFIYLVAYSAKTIIHDVVLPAQLNNRMLIQALTYSLERLLPIPLTEVSWGFLRTDKDDRHFRIFAIMRSELSKISGKAAAANLRFDAFVPVQIFSAGTAESPELSPADAILNYLQVDPGGKHLQLDTAAIGKSLRPERYRWLKKIYRVLLLLSALLILLQVLSRAGEHINVYTKLKSVERDVAEELVAAEKERDRLQEQLALYQKITDANYGKSNIVPVLSDLARRLPPHMWVSSYKQDHDQISLTIISAQDESNIARILESPLYTFINMSKSVNPSNHNAVILVKLRSLLP